MRFALPIPLLALAALAWGCDRPTTTSYDSDGDGHENRSDCAPMDPDVHPGAEDLCGDHIDNDCDGEVDEECRIDMERRGDATCVTACDGRPLCWSGDACGVNEADDAVCWGPYIYSAAHRPTRTLDESFTWVEFPCGVTRFGPVTCFGPKTFEEAASPALEASRTTLDPLVHLPRADESPDPTEPG